MAGSLSPNSTDMMCSLVGGKQHDGEILMINFQTITHPQCEFSETDKNGGKLKEISHHNCSSSCCFPLGSSPLQFTRIILSEIP